MYLPADGVNPLLFPFIIFGKWKWLARCQQSGEFCPKGSNINSQTHVQSLCALNFSLKETAGADNVIKDNNVIVANVELIM